MNNTGDQSFVWSADVISGSSYVAIDSLGGTLEGGASSGVTVLLRTAVQSLTAGVYSATIQFAKTSGVTYQSINRVVSITVNSDPADMTVSPASSVLAFGDEDDDAADFTFSSPTGAQYTITNSGGDTLTWSVAFTSTNPWLALSTTGGELTSGQSSVLTVSVATAAESAESNPKAALEGAMAACKELISRTVSVPTRR